MQIPLPLVEAELPSNGTVDVDGSMVALYGTWTEDMLLTNVMRTARIAGYHAYHTRFSLKSAAGFPDVCLVGIPGRQPGRLIFAELKRQGKWPTEGRLSRGVVPRWVQGQREWLLALSKTVAETYLWWPSDVHDIGTILTDGPDPKMACVRRIEEYLRGDGDDGGQGVELGAADRPHLAQRRRRARTP